MPETALEPMRLSAIAGEIVPMSLSALRTARHREDTFPKPVGRDGLAHLFDPLELQGLVRHKEPPVIVLAIVLAVVLAAAVWLARLRWWPYGPCPRCSGRRGRGIGSSPQAWSRCGGSGERLRPGARIWARNKELK